MEQDNTTGTSSADNAQAERPSIGVNAPEAPAVAPEAMPIAMHSPANMASPGPSFFQYFNPWINSAAPSSTSAQATVTRPDNTQAGVHGGTSNLTPQVASGGEVHMYSPTNLASPGPSTFCQPPYPWINPSSGAAGPSQGAVPSNMNAQCLNGEPYGMYMPYQMPPGQFSGYGQPGFPMSPVGMGHFFPTQPSPYLTKAGLPFKRPPGRPKGTTRKKRKSQDDDDFEEPDDPPFQSSTVTRSKTAGATTAAQGDPPRGQESQGQVMAMPVLPSRDKEDVSCPRDKKSACSKCRFWIARYVMLPCYDAAFCIVCLAKEHLSAQAEKRVPKCYGCGGDVQEYMLSFRCSIIGYNPYDDDED